MLTQVVYLVLQNYCQQQKQNHFAIIAVANFFFYLFSFIFFF